MRCSRCSRKATMFVSDPATPQNRLCEFCSGDPDIAGTAEAEPSPHKAGNRQRDMLDRIAKGNKPRVMTTGTFGAREADTRIG